MTDGNLRGREVEDKVLILRRIHVVLRLRADPGQHDIARRVHGFYAAGCALYRSLKPAIAITSELVLG